MGTSDWINLIAAILVGGGTLFLGIMAWRTICQSRSIQKTERRERLLNEIIEWAIDASKCDVALDPTAIVGITDTEKARLFVEALTSKGRTSITEMWGKSQYISKIVLSTWQDLQKAVEELIKNLGVLVELLDECSDAAASNLIDAFGRASAKVGEHKLKLYKSAEKVIEEATKIKTRDIS